MEGANHGIRVQGGQRVLSYQGLRQGDHILQRQRHLAETVGGAQARQQRHDELHIAGVMVSPAASWVICSRTSGGKSRTAICATAVACSWA